jgi:cellobiose transport system substrate-binding protein
MNRRGFLTGAGALGLAALAGCASPRTSTPGKLTLWYWTRGLSENVLKEALQRFDGFDPANVGHDLRPKLLAVMSGDAYIPDMSMVNDDIAGYFGDADHFVDMNPLGADRLRDRYLDWKWQAGSTPDGKLLGFPLDTGPSALYYRYDLFRQAGFPHEPADVEKAVATWDDYFRFGQELMKALPGRYMITDAKRVFTYSMGGVHRRGIGHEDRR